MKNTEKTSTGLDPNLAAALSYLGWFVTGVALLLIETENRFVRFHAMQSTMVFIGIAVLHILLQVLLPIIGAFVSGIIVFPISIVLWLILMFKAYQGERFKLPIVGDLAEQKI